MSSRESKIEQVNYTRFLNPKIYSNFISPLLMRSLCMAWLSSLSLQSRFLCCQCSCVHVPKAWKIENRWSFSVVLLGTTISCVTLWFLPDVPWSAVWSSYTHCCYQETFSFRGCYSWSHQFILWQAKEDANYGIVFWGK